MQPMRVAAGTQLFRAGDPSDFVYIIEDGEVAISVGPPDSPIEVARLQPGELFGESGVLEGRHRAATATATMPTQLLATEGAMFLQAFNLTNERSLSLIKLLCRRLRHTNARVQHHEEGGTQGARAACILITPHLNGLCPAYDHVPVEAAQLPFQVGNRFGGETLALSSKRGLCIPVHGEQAFAAPHFEILRRDGRLGIRDLGSRTGTLVNGQLLTRQSLEAFATLHPGENEVVAGRPGAPFRFVVRVDCVI